MNRQNHYFFAIELPEEIKRSLSNWVTKLKHTYTYKSWVHPSDYHLTLAFLGSASQSMLDDAVNELKSIISQHMSFPLAITGLGTFGLESSPRILWADVSKQAQLFDIQRDVWKACTKIGFKLDTKPFTPHITLARRCLELMDAGSLQQVVEKLPPIDEFNIQSLVLYRTNLNTIPKYESIVKFPLI